VMNRMKSKVALIVGLCVLVFAVQSFAQDTGSEEGKAKDTPAASAEEAKKEEAPKKKSGKFIWETSGAVGVATDFLAKLGTGDYKAPYDNGSTLLRANRTLEAFTADMQNARFDSYQGVSWGNGVPAKDGAKLTGTITYRDGTSEPLYINLVGDEDVAPQDRNTKWGAQTEWRVLDATINPAFYAKRSMESLDYFLLVSVLVLLGTLMFMIVRYVRGLWGSPYELYLMFFTKLTEYSAYGAASYCFVLYLARDIGLGDSGATAYYTVFSLTMTVTVMVVGAVCDTIGIKKSLLIGAFMLLTARFFMPLTKDIYLTSILGFLPMALGIAITGPVLKVGIKKFTTVEGATLGFGLFYTLMNIGFAIGGWMFDYIRTIMGDGGSTILPILGWELSTYQVILGIGFFINIPDLIAILLMREGVEMTEDGIVIKPIEKKDDDEVARHLLATVDERRPAMMKEVIKSAIVTGIVLAVAFALSSAGLSPGKWGWGAIVFVGIFGAGSLVYAALSYLGTFVRSFDRVMFPVRESVKETGRRLADNFSERPFWIYLFMLAVLVFVRLTFFIFHVMFPTYGIRVFGEGAMVGSIFGVLNPVMIVLLVPLISIMTVRVRSYTMLFAGTLISAGAVFLCFIPESMAIGLADTWFGQMIFERWLEVPMGQRDPFYISLIIFIIVFTIGEAIWSPRLMQFSAEIAPRGKEGSYIALAILPYFLGKALAGGMSGFLLTTYTPEGAGVYPDHELVWLWIGGMAMITPIGLVVFRNLFRGAEQDYIKKAAALTAGPPLDSEESSAP
jgi:MFS family permease